MEIGEKEIKEYFNKNTDNFSLRILLSDENFRKAMKTRADRACQLAKAIIQKIQHYSKAKPTTKEEIAILFGLEIEKCIELLKSASENYQELTSMHSRIVLNKISISFAYLLKYDFKNSKIMIEEAEKLLKDSKKKEMVLSIIPKEVLLQKIYVQKGLIEKAKENLILAAEYFTKSIESAQEYDPVTKKQ